MGNPPCLLDCGSLRHVAGRARKSAQPSCIGRAPRVRAGVQAAVVSFPCCCFCGVLQINQPALAPGILITCHSPPSTAVLSSGGASSENSKTQKGRGSWCSFSSSGGMSPHPDVPELAGLCGFRPEGLRCFTLHQPCSRYQKEVT